MIKPFAIILFFSLLFLGFSCGNKNLAQEQEEECVEQIKPDCVCTMEYDPVCGCNAKTFGNACTAECHGITKYTKGECDQNRR